VTVADLETIERMLWRREPVDPAKLADASRTCRSIIDNRRADAHDRQLAVTVLGRIARLPPATD
jgi:hypothetical protein